MDMTLIRQLLEAGVHFGHQTKRWNPKMRSFIYGNRSGIHVIDLQKTERCLKAAGDFLEDLAAQGSAVLFVGTKKQARPVLEAEAKRAGMPYVTTRWLGGTLTNFQTIRRNIDRLIELRQQQADGFFERISKKDAKRLTHQLEQLEEHLAGLAEMGRLPGALFIVDTKREEIAVREANRLKIPIIAICDTNANPDLIAYPVPGNDDAIRSVKLLVGFITERIVAGRARWTPPVSASPVEPSAALVVEGAAPSSSPAVTHGR